MQERTKDDGSSLGMQRISMRKRRNTGPSTVGDIGDIAAIIDAIFTDVAVQRRRPRGCKLAQLLRVATLGNKEIINVGIAIANPIVHGVVGIGPKIGPVSIGRIIIVILTNGATSPGIIEGTNCAISSQIGLHLTHLQGKTTGQGVSL